MKSVILGFILLSSAALEAQDLESMKQKFIGDYELVNYVTFGEDGTERDIHYTADLARPFRQHGWFRYAHRSSIEGGNSSERTIGGFGYWGKSHGS